MEKINKNASYLIAMSVIDVSKIPAEGTKENDNEIPHRTIKKPGNEPIIHF